MTDRKARPLCGAVLVMAGVLALTGCPEESESGARQASGDNGVAKKLEITGLEDHNGEAITVSLMVGLNPESGGEGTAAGGKASIAMKFPNKSQKDQDWTGTGTFLAWMVTGDIAAAQENGNSTEGLVGKQAQVSISEETTEVDFSAEGNTVMTETILQLFIMKYSPEGYGD